MAPLLWVERSEGFIFSSHKNDYVRCNLRHGPRWAGGCAGGGAFPAGGHRAETAPCRAGVSAEEMCLLVSLQSPHHTQCSCLWPRAGSGRPTCVTWKTTLSPRQGWGGVFSSLTSRWAGQFSSWRVRRPRSLQGHQLSARAGVPPHLVQSGSPREEGCARRRLASCLWEAWFGF